MSVSNQALKNQIFSNLKKKGFDQQIKKQLRMKLIEQLKNKNLLETKNQQKKLFKRVISSIIIEELQQSQFPYSQSIFSMESGYQDSYMTRDQLIQMMTLKRNQIRSSESILQFILRRKHPFSQNTLQNIQIQTNPQQIGYTLQQKLMMVDQQYRINLVQKQKINQNNILDRKKLELELTQKFKKQMDLFKQFQTHKIKIKQSQKWRRKFQQYSNGLFQQYTRKYDQLRKKDKVLNEQFLLKNNQYHHKIVDTQKTYKQKVQALELKTLTVKAQMQNLNKEKKIFQQQINKKQKELNQKIREYDSLILNVNEKIKYQVNLAKLSIQQQYQQKQAQTLRRKKVIDQDYGKLMGIKDSIDIVQKQNIRLGNENNLLRTQLSTLQVQLKNTVVELGNKISRIQVLKDDLIQTQQKLKLLEQRNKEQVKKNRRYESQIVSMRDQLQKLRQKQNINKNNISQLSQSSFQIDKEKSEKQYKRIDELNRKMERMKNERKKDIEKFKLEI